MVSGDSVGTIMGGAVFDTGTANMQIATPAGSLFPSIVSVGSSVLVTTPSGFSYSYIATAPTPGDDRKRGFYRRDHHWHRLLYD